MKMKYTVISFLIAFIAKMSTVNALETDNKQQETFSLRSRDESPSQYAV